MRTSLAVVIAIGGGFASAEAASAQAGVAAQCTPPGGLHTNATARAVRPDGGGEVTEYFVDGVYRVTRCDARGGLAKSVEMSTVLLVDGSQLVLPRKEIRPAPEAKQVITVNRSYGDPQDPEVAAELRSVVSELNAEVLPPTDPSLVTPPSREPLLPGPDEDGPVADASAGEAAPCQNNTHLWAGSRWPNRRFSYYTRQSTFPAGDTTRGAIISGFHHWNNTDNQCGWADQDNGTADWIANTSTGVHTYDDGINAIDFGDMGNIGCAGALACVLSARSGSTLVWADMRFSASRAWVYGGQSSGYDVENVATHEAGHAMHDLDDLYNTREKYLTMYGYASKGETRKRTLGRGDIVGMRAAHP